MVSSFAQRGVSLVCGKAQRRLCLGPLAIGVILIVRRVSERIGDGGHAPRVVKPEARLLV